MKKYIVSFCSSGNRGNEEFWKLRQKRLNENSLKNGNIDGIFSWNGEKLKKLGWEPPVNFKESLSKTVNWTLKNPQWL